MKPSTKYPIPVPIRQKLSELRGMIGQVIAVQGIAVFAIWALAAFWLFGVLDYLPVLAGAAESPRIVRMIMLAILVSGCALILYVFFWQRWLVHWNDSTLALAIERLYPKFQSSLVTTVQASDVQKIDDVEHPTRPGVLDLARQHAESQIATIDISKLIRFETLRIELGLLAAMIVTSVFAALFVPGWVAHWSSRLFALSDAAWPRQTELGLVGVELDVPAFTGKNVRERYSIEFENGTVRVPKGQPVQLRTWAQQTSDSRKDVTCTVYYRQPDGMRGRANMRRSSTDGTKQFFTLDGPPFEGLQESLSLTLFGGDNRLNGLFVEAVEGPMIAQLDLDVEYPTYLQRSTKTVWGNERIPYRNGLRLPQGSNVTLSINSNTPIRRYELSILSTSDSNENRLIEVNVPLEKPSKQIVHAIGKLESNVLVEARLWDTNGVCSTRVQQFVISAIHDLVPQIDFVLKGIGTAVTENAVLSTRSTIRDDYDIQSAWIETVLGEAQPQSTPLEVSVDGKAERDLDLKALRVSGTLHAKVGTTLALMIAAQDYLDFASSPHVGRSSPIQLNIVTPDQLLIILERRELAMRSRLEQIINELGQLRDLLTIMSKSTRVDEKKPNENGSTDSAVGEESTARASDGATENPEQRRLRLQLLRAQQSSAQANKSDGELRGVETEISQIIAELINNRVDSKDRRTRLEEKIRQPLHAVLESEWDSFAKQIKALEKQLVKEAESDSKAVIQNAIESDNQVIAKLQEILDAMTDIEDFNELMDMVRDLLQQQTKVQDDTKAEKKRIDLELLK